MAWSYLNNRQTYRLNGWDYGSSGWYFITINTYKYQNFFGIIRNGIIGLTIPGCVSHYFWKQIPKCHPNANVDTFNVMPNHAHGIIRIDRPESSSVGTLHATSLHNSASNIMSNISPKSGSLSVIIRSYKSAVTRYCHQNGFNDFSWYSRFYDHIIRNNKALINIRKYIYNNTLQWEKDRVYR